MAARSEDGRPISDYAGEFPDREDVAESYGAYAVWKMAQRSSSPDRNAAIIADTIPHRLDYLDSLGEEYQPGTDSCPTVTPQAPTNPRAATRGRFTTVSWTPPKPAVSVSHYEWRVASRVSGLGAWTAFGHARTSSLALRNQGRGNMWIVEVRAMWGSEPGPPFRLRYRS